MPCLDTFGLEIQEVIVIFEISTVKFFKNESLTCTVNFGIRSAFSKGPESAFSEVPGPGPGPVCFIKYAIFQNSSFSRPFMVARCEPVVLLMPLIFLGCLRFPESSIKIWGMIIMGQNKILDPTVCRRSVLVFVLKFKLVFTQHSFSSSIQVA